MLSALAQNWWVVLIRGLAAIGFGIMAFAWPSITLKVLLLLFGVYAVIDGLTAVWFALSGRSNRSFMWELLLVGVLSVMAGLAAIFWPGVTAKALLLVIAAWAIVRGVFEIMAAIQLRKDIENEWLLGLGGLFSILFGVLLVAWPSAGALAVIWIIASWAIVFGVMFVALALRLKGLKGRLRLA